MEQIGGREIIKLTYDMTLRAIESIANTAVGFTTPIDLFSGLYAAMTIAWMACESDMSGKTRQEIFGAISEIAGAIAEGKEYNDMVSLIDKWIERITAITKRKEVKR